MRVYDSYAHHPNEIVGDLQAARSLAGEGRVVVAFQPHMVSRTRIFGHDMGVALGAADDVVVMDIYVAREDPEPGVTGALVADAVPLDPDHVVFEPSWSAVAGHLVERARPGDVVLTLGCRRRHPAWDPRCSSCSESEVHPMSMRDRLRRKKKAEAPVAAPSAPPPSAGPDEETVRIARKDFRRRRNAGRWRRIRLVLLALLLVAAVSASVWVVFFSSYVTARDVEITGTTTIGDARVEDAARVPTGTPLARVDLGAIKSRVESIAAVKRVEVSRSWPHAVHIEVTERTPLAVVDRGQGLQALDAEGVLFGHYDSRPEAAAPRHHRGRHQRRGAGRGRSRHRLAAHRHRLAGRHHRDRQRRQDPAGPRQRPPGAVGECRGLQREGRGARRTPAAAGPADRRLGPGPSHHALTLLLVFRAAAPRVAGVRRVRSPTLSTQPQVDITLTLYLKVRVREVIRRTSPGTSESSSGSRAGWQAT